MLSKKRVIIIAIIVFIFLIIGWWFWNQNQPFVERLFSNRMNSQNSTPSPTPLDNNIKNKVIIITDCALDAFWHDPDDALALLYLFTNQNVDVEAVITTFGNTSEPQVFNSVQLLLQETGFTTTVIRGAKNKTDINIEVKNFLENLNASDYTLLSIGPLTNLQVLDKEKLQSFKKIYVMGGALKHGNVIPLFKKEWNFAKDPDSAKYVLETSNVELITLDTTTRISLQPAVLRTIFARYPILGKRIRAWDTLNKFLYWHVAYPHDLIAAMAITNSGFFNVSTENLKVLNGQLKKDDTGTSQNVYDITDITSFYAAISDWAQKL